MNERLVLLAYADHADHQGANVYPSVGLIAEKCDCSERHVRRVTRRLVDLGFLIDEGRTTAIRADRAPVCYRIPIDDDLTVPSGREIRPPEYREGTASSGRGSARGDGSVRSSSVEIPEENGPRPDRSVRHDLTATAARPDESVRHDLTDRSGEPTTEPTTEPSVEPPPPPSQQPTATAAAEISIEERRHQVLDHAAATDDDLLAELAAGAETLEELDDLLAAAESIPRAAGGVS